jgi:hypothetical protein
MSNHDDDWDEDEKIIGKALKDLRNLNIQSDSPVVGRDLREIILGQMELSHALFDRQHRDVLKQMKLNSDVSEREHRDIGELHESVKLFIGSSKRVEKLTYALIGLTGILTLR